MSITKLVSLVAVCLVSSVCVAACAVDSSDAGEETPDSEDQDLSSAKIHECATDSDCIAVERGGCCVNGTLEAINKKRTRAYNNATKCKNSAPQVCPPIVIVDKRIAQCNTSAKQCEMVDILDIACGGFTRNPHACPAGYDCQVTGHPDAPGKCTKN